MNDKEKVVLVLNRVRGSRNPDLGSSQVGIRADKLKTLGKSTLGYNRVEDK